MNAKTFLESIGIDLKATTLIVNIDGVNRQPNLLKLMEDYYTKKKEHDKKPT